MHSCSCHCATWKLWTVLAGLYHDGSPNPSPCPPPPTLLHRGRVNWKQSLKSVCVSYVGNLAGVVWPRTVPFPPCPSPVVQGPSATAVHGEAVVQLQPIHCTHLPVPINPAGCIAFGYFLLHLAELSTVEPVHGFVIGIAEKKVHHIPWGALLLRGASPVPGPCVRVCACCALACP